MQKKNAVLIFLLILITIVIIYIMQKDYPIEQKEEIKRKGTVEATVIDSTGKPKPGVMFFVEGFPGNNKTDSTGKFIIKADEGEYNIVFYENDGDTASALIKILPDTVKEIVFNMNEKLENEIETALNKEEKIKSIIEKIYADNKTEYVYLTPSGEEDDKIFSLAEKKFITDLNESEKVKNKKLLENQFIKQPAFTFPSLIHSPADASFFGRNNISVSRFSPDENTLWIHQGAENSASDYNYINSTLLGSGSNVLLMQLGPGNNTLVHNDLSINNAGNSRIVVQDGFNNFINQTSNSDGSVSHIFQAGQNNFIDIQDISYSSFYSVQQTGWNHTAFIKQIGFSNKTIIIQEN